MSSLSFYSLSYSFLLISLSILSALVASRLNMLRNDYFLTSLMLTRFKTTSLIYYTVRFSADYWLSIHKLTSVFWVSEAIDYSLSLSSFVKLNCIVERLGVSVLSTFFRKGLVRFLIGYNNSSTSSSSSSAMTPVSKLSQLAAPRMVDFY